MSFWTVGGRPNAQGAELAALKQAHDVLRAKLLPKVYEYGFLNPDVEVFK